MNDKNLNDAIPLAPQELTPQILHKIIEAHLVILHTALLEANQIAGEAMDYACDNDAVQKIYAKTFDALAAYKELKGKKGFMNEATQEIKNRELSTQEKWNLAAVEELRDLRKEKTILQTLTMAQSQKIGMAISYLQDITEVKTLNPNMLIDYKVYLDEFSLERKLKDVLQESIPGENMLGGKLVKITVTVEYEK